MWNPSTLIWKMQKNFWEIIDDDLGLVEEVLGIDDEDFCQCDCDDDCDCDGADYDEDDTDIIEVECPECGEVVCFYNELLDDEDVDTVEILCPKCDAVVYTFERDLREDLDDDITFDDDDDE